MAFLKKLLLLKYRKSQLIIVENKKFDCSSGRQLRDFIYVEDVINAIIKILKSKTVKGEIINIGSGKPLTVTINSKL